MPIARIKRNFFRVAFSVLISTVLIYGPRSSAFAQTTDLPGEPVQQARAVSGPSPASNQTSPDQNQPATQSKVAFLQTFSSEALSDI
jgi:hypothetical protein